MTPTPPFPMENNHSKKEDVHNPIWDAIIEKECDKVLQEANKNHVSVSATPDSKPYSLYNPHNYRQYFDFDTTSFRPKTDPPTSVAATAWRTINSTEICFDDYLGFRIVVKRTQVEMTLKNDEWHIIYTEPIEGIHPQIVEICKELLGRAIAILKKFISQYGGHSSLRLLNLTSENKVKSESAVNLLADRLTFRNEVMKKVYMEKNIELSDPVFAANYLTTRAIEKVSPELNTALQAISSGLTAIVEGQRSMAEQTLNPLTEQVKLHLKVQNETLATMKAIRKGISKLASKESGRKEKVKKLKEEWGW